MMYIKGMKGKDTMKDNENSKQYLNDYECDCGAIWSNEDDCMCNDRCPDCDNEIEPFNSIEYV